MSPTTISASTRSRGGSVARRRSVLRRRRGAVAFVAVILAAIGVALAMPLARRAVNEFTLPLSYSDVIRQQAAAKHLDPALIAAVIYAETKFDPRPSPAGAQGLMQILPQTAEFLARRSGGFAFRVEDLARPDVNIAYGSYYLRYLLDRYGESTVLTLAAYNAGEANVDRWVAEDRARGRTFTVRRIPFPETRAYVAKVLNAQQRYRKTYPTELGYQ
jgi:soluble lytic murein transglycosylase